jgi:tripartite-type tricarboxylate transporter receptor subunit TctC
VAYAKANPGKMSYASPSVGTTPHLAVERLKQMTGIDIVHVAYRGAPPAMQALITNDVQLYLAGWGVGRGFVEGGKAVALAVASEQRLPNLPNLPTAGESGVPGYVAENWWGLAAPKGTPPAIVARLHAAVKTALADLGVAKRLDEMGFLPGGETPDVFARNAAAEAKVWSQTVETGKLAID